MAQIVFFQTCLTRVTISLAILRKVIKCQWPRLKLHKMCEYIKSDCRLYCIEILYSLRQVRHIEIPVHVLCDFSITKKGLYCKTIP